MTPTIVAAANAFLATLSDTEKSTGLFDWSDTAQKQRWSNFPPAGFTRAGLMWGNLSAAQQDAWLPVMAGHAEQPRATTACSPNGALTTRSSRRKVLAEDLAKTTTTSL